MNESKGEAAADARTTRLRELIAELPATPGGVRSQVDWKQRVLAAIDVAEAAPEGLREPPAVRSLPRIEPIGHGRKSSGTTHVAARRWIIAASAGAIAAAAAILLVVSRGPAQAPPPAATPTVAFALVPGERLHRGDEPSVGDTLIFRGVTTGAGELRVYDPAGVEQARCTVVAPGCAVERDGGRTTLRLTLRLREPGALRAVMFETPLATSPGGSGGIDADLGVAARAGIASGFTELVVR